MGKRKWTPEERAAWEAELAASAEARRRLAASLERWETQLREHRERQERRRRLLLRLLPFRRAA
jgi:hypothetical protein